MPLNRKSVSESIDQQAASSVEHNNLAGAKKVFSAGPGLDIIGSVATAFNCGKGASLWLYNNSSSVAFVRFGAAAVAAPTGIADGIAIPANSYIELNSGNNDFVRASAATVGCYKVIDDTAYRISNS
jgi:hypothetical protein